VARSVVVPGAGEVVDLDARLCRVRIELPGHSIGHLNSYVYRTDDGLLVIDVPWDAPGSAENYLRLLEAAGLDVHAIRTILVTHYHSDHWGIAGRLRALSGARVGLHRLDAWNLVRRFDDGRGFARDLRAWLELVGADDRATDIAMHQAFDLVGQDGHLRPDFLIADGELLHQGGVSLRALHTPGHTSGHLAFADLERSVVFTGDHIYRRRRGTASTRLYSSADPMGDFWRANDALLALAPRTVHPAHDESFDDLPARLDELRGVAARHLEQILWIADRPRSAADIAREVPRSRAWHELGDTAVLTAIGETHAYLIDAAARGLVRRIPGPPELWVRDDAGPEHPGDAHDPRAA